MFCLCNAIAMFCLHFKRFAIKIHTAFKQIHTKFKLKFTMVSYLTLQMHGSAVPQPCKCKVSEFLWKLANVRVSMTDSTYSYKCNKTHIHTLSVVIQSSMQLQQKETGTNIHTFNKAPVYFLLSWRPQQNFILPNVSKARYKMIGNAHSH